MYPELCQGCIIIRILYEDYKREGGQLIKCHILNASDDNPTDCPCLNCLVKVTCHDDCKLAMGYLLNKKKEMVKSK